MHRYLPIGSPLLAEVAATLNDNLNAFASSPHYIGVRYVVTVLSIALAALKFLDPLVRFLRAKNSMTDRVRIAAKEPTFEQRFMRLADMHLEQSRDLDDTREQLDHAQQKNNKMLVELTRRAERIDELRGALTALRNALNEAQPEVLRLTVTTEYPDVDRIDGETGA